MSGPRDTRTEAGTGEPRPNGPETAEMRALDRALAAALEPPALPAGFRARLDRALAEAGRTGGRRAARVEALEHERRERLAELEAGYLRLRRRTLGALIGGAFAAGVAIALVLPWFESALGADAPLALAGAGALVGLVLIGAAMGLGRGGATALRLFR